MTIMRRTVYTVNAINILVAIFSIATRGYITMLNVVSIFLSVFIITLIYIMTKDRVDNGTKSKWVTRVCFLERTPFIMKKGRRRMTLENVFIIKIGNGFFSGYDDNKVTFVLDNQPGAMSLAKRYDSLNKAKEDATIFNGKIVRIEKGENHANNRNWRYSEFV